MSGTGSSNNPFGPGALNNLIYFHVPNGRNVTLSCGSSGSRCAFQRNEYLNLDPDGGAIADQLPGAVWTTTDEFATDVVNLNLCALQNGCVPACFSDCACRYSDGAPCEQTTPFPTAVPTIPPPTPSPVPKVCAATENVNLCPTVAIDTNLLAGQTCAYCYNFCNGKFLSCCEENGTCGRTTCEADAVTGEAQAIFGCPEIIVTTGGNNEVTAAPGLGPTIGGSAAIGLASSSSPVLAALVTLLLMLRG